MTAPAKQPARRPMDGSVEVSKLDDDKFRLSVTTNGVEETIVMSSFNAWRAFGMLAFLLGITLPSALLKRIQG